MDASAKMELFQNLFYVSAALAVIGLGLAIFFYFYFDIRYIYMFISGRDRKESVEQMTKRSVRNGRLRRMNRHTTPPVSGQNPSAQVGVPVTKDQRRTVPLNAAGSDQMPSHAVEDTSLLTDLDPTEPMKPRASEETHSAAGATEILSGQAAAPSLPDGGFVLTEHTLLIHTGEMI